MPKCSREEFEKRSGDKSNDVRPLKKSRKTVLNPGKFTKQVFNEMKESAIILNSSIPNDFMDMAGFKIKKVLQEDKLNPLDPKKLIPLEKPEEENSFIFSPDSFPFIPDDIDITEAILDSIDKKVSDNYEYENTDPFAFFPLRPEILNFTRIHYRSDGSFVFYTRPDCDILEHRVFGPIICGVKI